MAHRYATHLASKLSIGAATIALLAGPSSPIPAAPTEPAAAALQPVVGTEWLAAHLQDPDLVILDARPALRDYLMGHIPGAQPLGVENVRSAAGGVPGQIFPPEVLAVIAGRVGIDRGSRAVVYGAESDPDASFVASALRLSGLDDVAILDGGMKRWSDEKRPVTAERKPVAERKPMVSPPSGRLADFEEVRNAIKAGAAILDVRPADQYEAGHIPGALSRVWKKDVVPDGQPDAGLLRSPADLEKEYAALGLTKDKPVIVYCNTGHMASEVYYTLRYRLGHTDVRLYDGSWTEWAMHPDAPKETGAPKP